MPEVISNTSPLQYLHQAGLLSLLPSIAGTIVIPPAVRAELMEGRLRGVDLPDVDTLPWIIVRTPASTPALPLASDLGAGEAEVLALALESPGSVVVMDDALGRQVAQTLRIRLSGTLGLLLDAKRRGLLPAVGPTLDRLQALRFRISRSTREAVLRIAGEEPLPPASPA